MNIEIINHQVVSDTGTVIDLPKLPTDVTVRVWAVPAEYSAEVVSAVVVDGLFVSFAADGKAIEIPACDHSAPLLEEVLPAHQEAVLLEQKTAKNDKINEWRLAANQSTFTYQGKTFACDALSRSDIEGVANTVNLTGAFPAGFPNAWKAVDNTYIAISTIKDFGLFYKAMADQGSVNFAHAQELKAALTKAQTVGEVDAIVW